LLALLLWCLVITVTKPVSISLVGSTSTGKESVSLDFSVPETSESPAAETVAE